jgi:hypothetical protein
MSGTTLSEILKRNLVPKILVRSRRNHAADCGLRTGASTLLLVGILAMCTGCVRIDKEKQRELDSILGMRNTAREIEEFKNKSYCQQIDLYLYAMKQMPPISLATYLAANGESVLPTLLNRLSTETDEINQGDLISALAVMSIEMTSLKENKNVVEVVRHKIEEMKNPFNRERAEKSLRMILETEQK